MNKVRRPQLSPKSVILIGGNLSSGGGVNRVIRDLSTIFSEALGLKTTVIAFDDKAPSYTFSPKVEIERCPGAQSSKGFWSLMRNLCQRDCDYIIGFWHWHNIRISIACMISGKLCILMEHISWHHAPLRTILARILTYKTARSVCVLNSSDYNYYRKFLRNTVLLPNPVSKQIESQKVEREKIILAVGHLTPLKNFTDAVAAFAKSGLAREGWRLEIVGTGPEAQSLNVAIRDLNLSDAARVEAPMTDIEKAYARASILLVTSKVEAFSLALAEAMLHEIVPIAYAVDGPAFILKDNQDLLVPPGRADLLAEKLRVIAHSDNLPARGKKMSQIIEGRFSQEVICQKWKELLDL